LQASAHWSVLANAHLKGQASARLKGLVNAHWSAQVIRHDNATYEVTSSYQKMRSKQHITGRRCTFCHVR
jgi:hypothetical protein